MKELPLDPIAFIITKLQAIEKADKKVCVSGRENTQQVLYIKTSLP